jgi:hypothetical protein
MRFRLVVCLAVLLSLGSPLLAQEVAGAVQGRVLLPDSVPAEGVRLTITGPNLQGPRSAATDPRGFFQIRALPPGAYELRVARIGYRPVVVHAVDVVLGRMTGLAQVVLVEQAVALDAIEVVARTVSIDPVRTTVGGTLDAADYASLPVDRDYKSLIRILAHANESTRGDPINVAGSTGLENMYYIDGVNVTDPLMANRATSLPYNFVRAVEVKTGGYEAMYGRALGAVVNAVTYSGTNDFEANIFGFVQPRALALSPRVLPAVTESGAVSYDVGARVSGPVLRDRLWYSAALNPRVDRVDKEVIGHGLLPDRTTAVRFAGKLTWRASSTAGLELSVFGDPTTREGVNIPSGILSIATPDAVLLRATSGGVIGSLRATVTPSPAVLLEASVSRQWDRYSWGGATPLGRSTPQYLDYVTLSVGGGFEMYQDDDRGRTGIMARGTFTLGGHTVVAGAEYEDALTATTRDGSLVVRIDTASYVTGRLGYPRARFHNLSPAAYLQDSWRLSDRLTLNAGLRWSGQFLTGASGRVVQEIPDEWQPRAGFSWQVGRLGTQRFFGSYGRVYETLPTHLAAIQFTDHVEINTFYSSDPRQPGAVPDSVQDRSRTEAETSVSVPGLHGDNFDEYTLGYERLLGAGARLTVRGLYRHLRSTYLLGWDFSRTPDWVLGTPGQGAFDFLPAPRRDYTALEIAAEGAWRGVRYRASYVLSRTWGNYPGLYSSDVGEWYNSPGMNLMFLSPEQARNSSGLLPNDRTHVVKLSAAYSFRFGLEGGASLTAESGSPINEFGTSEWIVPIFVVPRGSAGRTPALWNLDFRLAYALPLRGGPSGRVILDVLHVGNPRRATIVDETHYWSPNLALPNAHYKQPLAYQPPMGARLGVEVGF